jgi:hypothetical protein
MELSDERFEAIPRESRKNESKEMREAQFSSRKGWASAEFCPGDSVRDNLQSKGQEKRAVGGEQRRPKP